MYLYWICVCVFELASFLKLKKVSPSGNVLGTFANTKPYILRRGSYLVLVFYQVTEDIIRIQNPPVTVFNMVSPNQEVSFL